MSGFLSYNLDSSIDQARERRFLVRRMQSPSKVVSQRPYLSPSRHSSFSGLGPVVVHLSVNAADSQVRWSGLHRPTKPTQPIKVGKQTEHLWPYPAHRARCAL